MPKKDFSHIAFAVVQQATGESIAPVNPKNQAAVEVGRLGGTKVGAACARSLTPTRRIDIAKAAAQAQWKSSKSKSG